MVQDTCALEPHTCRILDFGVENGYGAREFAAFTSRMEAAPFTDDTCLCSPTVEKFEECPDFKNAQSSCYGETWRAPGLTFPNRLRLVLSGRPAGVRTNSISGSQGHGARDVGLR